MYRVFLRKLKHSYGSNPKTLFRELLYSNDVNAFNPDTEYFGEGFGDKIQNPVLVLEESLAGSFTFDIPPSHRLYSEITILDCLIEIERDNEPYWAGRILSTGSTFNKMMSVTCEGLFACLNDTVQPYMIYDDYPTNIFRMLITNHNNICTQRKELYKKIRETDFIISRNDIYGPANSSEQPAEGAMKIHYEVNSQNTMTAIQDFISQYGGYLRITFDFAQYDPNLNDDIQPSICLEWCDDAADISGRVLNNKRWMSTQVVQYASNLIDMKLNMAGENIYTVLIPRGNNVQREILEGLMEYGQFYTDTGYEDDDYKNIFTEEQIKEYGYYWTRTAQQIPYHGEGDTLTFVVDIHQQDIVSHYKDKFPSYDWDTMMIITVQADMFLYAWDKNKDPNLESSYRLLNYQRVTRQVDDGKAIFIANALQKIWKDPNKNVDPEKEILFCRAAFNFGYRTHDYYDPWTSQDNPVMMAYLPSSSMPTVTVYSNESKLSIFSWFDEDYYPTDYEGNRIPDGDTGEDVKYIKRGKCLIDTSLSTGVGKYGWIEKVIDWDIDLVPPGQNYYSSVIELYNAAKYEMQYGRYLDFSVEVNAFDLALYNERKVMPVPSKPSEAFFLKDGKLFVPTGSGLKEIIITDYVEEVTE